MLILYVVNVSCSGNSNRKGSTHSTDVPTPLGHASLLEESPGAISEGEMEMTVYPIYPSTRMYSVHNFITSIDLAISKYVLISLDQSIQSLP